MEIALTLKGKERTEPLTFSCRRMVNAGYVGRDQAEVRRHIDELAKKGIPGPKKTPTLYPVIPRTLITDSQIDVYGDETCGEVEYVLLIENKNRIYGGVGSDHTDRHLEETDIPRAKQICPNVISKNIWPLAEVSDHWDDLVIEAWVLKEGEEILYQQGPLALIMDPEALMEFVASQVDSPLENLIVYSGTLGSLTGGFVFGDQFRAKLKDPKLGRSLELKYEILPMHYMNVG